MIFIISLSNDRSTSDVIEWLLSNKIPFYRFNFDNIDLYNISINACSVKRTYFRINLNDDDSNAIDSRKITCVWFRRMSSSFRAQPDLSYKNVPDILLKLAAAEERTYFYRVILNTLNNLPWLNHFESAINDKYETLRLALQIGLSIPKTIVTNSKVELQKFIKTNDKVIVKPIYNVFYLFSKECTYISYTSILTARIVKYLPKKVFPILSQELINKKYEIRTFYLNSEFYSMAIFSQKNTQTQVDFRQYDYDNPNRAVPYKLPTEIESRLKLLMDKLGVNSGSIDLIKSIDNEYIFLEVNPVGQFGMVSYPCNYNLNGKIAEYLIKLTINEDN